MPANHFQTRLGGARVKVMGHKTGRDIKSLQLNQLLCWCQDIVGGSHPRCENGHWEKLRRLLEKNEGKPTEENPNDWKHAGKYFDEEAAALLRKKLETADMELAYVRKQQAKLGRRDYPKRTVR